MTNEELQKAIEFITKHQARFAADIQQLQGSQRKPQESQAQTAEPVNRLAAVTARGFEDTTAKLNAPVGAQMRTDENVRDLAAVVDRYFSEGRNGG